MDEDVSKLFELVEQGDLQGLKDLIDDTEVKKRKGDSLLNSEKYNQTALHLAAFCDHPSIIKFLLSSSEGGGRAAGFSKVLAKDGKGWTAIHYAASKGNLECCQALAEGSIVDNGERAELLNAVENEGWTILHAAAFSNRPHIIRWIFSSEEGEGRSAGFTKILAKTNDGTTAMYVAAEQGHLESCQALVEASNIENGERDELLNGVENDGWTVLHLAAFCGHVSIIKWLLSSSEGGGRALGFTMLLAKTTRGTTAMHHAAGRGHLECCQALVEGSLIDNGEQVELMNGVDDDGWTILHRAAICGQTSFIQWLLSSSEEGGRAVGFTSSSITAKALDGSSALHIVVRSGSIDALNALLSGCTPAERSTLFLSVDEHGWTPLHEAARRCEPKIIRELLLHHPETQTIVDARDNRGMTALERAEIGGIDEESKEEWEQVIDDYDNINIAQASTIEALLSAQKARQQ